MVINFRVIHGLINVKYFCTIKSFKHIHIHTGAHFVRPCLVCDLNHIAYFQLCDNIEKER